MAALGTTAQVEPPAAAGVAFHATRTARLLRRIDHLIGHVIALPMLNPPIAPQRVRPGLTFQDTEAVEFSNRREQMQAESPSGSIEDGSKGFR
jgi:hypothetical protein